MAVIPAADVLKDDENLIPERQMIDIVVMSDREAAVASLEAMIEGTVYKWTASARVHPDDRRIADEEIGRKLAIARVLEKASKQLVREADGRFKHRSDIRTDKRAKREAKELVAVEEVKKEKPKRVRIKRKDRKKAKTAE